jgi:antitoxin component of RelBE/YafQ-DinJ toxin-antitoxin module
MEMCYDKGNFKGRRQMPKLANLRVKIGRSWKAEDGKLLNRMWMDFTMAIKALVRQAALEQAKPFRIRFGMKRAGVEQRRTAMRESVM